MKEAAQTKTHTISYKKGKPILHQPRPISKSRVPDMAKQLQTIRAPEKNKFLSVLPSKWDPKSKRNKIKPCVTIQMQKRSHPKAMRSKKLQNSETARKTQPSWLISEFQRLDLLVARVRGQVLLCRPPIDQLLYWF